MLGVLKMTEGPVVHLLVHFGITWFSSLLVSVDCRNEGFVVRPPELHVMPIFLHRQSVERGVIKETSMNGVPSSLEHPIQHVAACIHPSSFAAHRTFMDHKPGRLDGVAWIQCLALQVGETLPSGVASSKTQLSSG